MAEAEGARALFKQVADRVDERLFGVREPLRLVMVGILTGNHVLIDDVPGVGKTTLVRMLSTLLGLRFQRVQFTPDLMPSDITGTSVLNLKTNDFQFRPGPLFTQVLLADEINRATPKTQAALLEAMQERQVTVDGETHPLPDPFFVLATQNPIELEGTFPIPTSARSCASCRRNRRIAHCRRSRSATCHRSGSSAMRSRRSGSSTRSAPTSSRSPGPPATIPSSRWAPVLARSSRWATRPERSRCSTAATTSCPTT